MGRGWGGWVCGVPLAVHHTSLQTRRHCHVMQGSSRCPLGNRRGFAVHNTVYQTVSYDSCAAGSLCLTALHY